MDRPFAVGFYGKLPSHGDFLRRRTSEAFIGVWDGWLQACIAASRAALGDRWLDVYLTSPVWRFAGAAGICGSAPIVGVMVPSVDRVGRYFPLTLVAELPGHVSPLAAATVAESFFDRAERLVIETLEADEIDFDAFDEQVAALAGTLEAVRLPPPVMLDPDAAGVLDPAAGYGVQIPIGSSPQLLPVLTQVLSHRLSAVYEPLMLWWSGGSAVVEPSCLMSSGLPQPDSFAALLDGSWADRQWRPVPAQIDAAATDDTLVPETLPLVCRSAAASDVGRVRTINQDAFLERPEVGMWVVADGLGGHSDGEVASRMVCDAFADLVPESSFENVIEAAAERMHQVNDQLIRMSERSLLGVRCGSTVAALLVRGARLAILWAGDSRVYRWRHGRLDQLTRDHSLVELEGLSRESSGVSNIVTRAVGGEPTLLLDVYRDQMRAGDRYLLCSDGLTRTLPEDRIAAGLAPEDPAVVVKELVEATLDAGAPDNVTVLLVDVSA